MRRSAAPSQQPCKKACFRVPYANRDETSNQDQTHDKKASTLCNPEMEQRLQPARTTLDILRLIRDSNNLAGCSQYSEQSSPELIDQNLPDLAEESDTPSTPDHAPPHSISSPSADCVPQCVLQPANLLPSADKTLYSVLYCKLSTKKHKKWEGDGILSISSHTLVLRDLEGKELSRSSGYKFKELSQLEEGSVIKVGSKECEIQSMLPPPAGNISNKENFSEKQGTDQVIKKPCFPKVVPTLGGLKLKTKPPHSADDPNALVMPRPDTQHQEIYNQDGLPIVDVVVDPLLATKLRPHQVEGVRFLYKCVMDMGTYPGQGAILADEMGLGKTLQVIALIWTLLKQGPYGGIPVLRKVLVITPGSLVKNWVQEFYKWLGKLRIYLYAVDHSHRVEDFLKCSRTYPILIISYEMFVRYCDILESVTFDLVVCDEGHRLKNSNIKTTSSITALTTGRKVLLTGTPIQNDLQEFYSLLSICNPRCLGTASEFRRKFEEPIVAAQQPNCSEQDIELGSERAQELAELTSAFVLRRTQSTLNHFLPTKAENVVFCRLSPLQKELYAGFVEQSWEENPLRHIMNLRKLCNHPQLIMPSDNRQPLPLCKSSGKLQVLSAMLSHLRQSSPGERVVLVSHSTQMLDLLEKWCQSQNYPVVRLDGSTPTASRQALVNAFNSTQSPHWLFLLSAKAGGLGLSLVGASRLVLFDPDWNPVSDLQALARIWREGQLRPTHLYRLLSAGSIEEKIYQRQISKQGLCEVLNDCQDMAKFHNEDLKDLFTFDPDSTCSTHELLECECKGPAAVKSKSNLSMAELFHWDHHIGPVEPTLDPVLAAAGNNISFLFCNTTSKLLKDG